MELYWSVVIIQRKRVLLLSFTCFDHLVEFVDDLFSFNAFYVKVTELQSMDAITPPAYSLPHENTTHKQNTITKHVKHY